MLLNLLTLQLVLMLFVITSTIDAGVNFRPDRELLNSSLLLSHVNLSDSSVADKDTLDCLVAEGCISSAEGVRTLLRFSTKIDNIGDTDFSLGVPPKEKVDNFPWHWDTCHEHWHVEGYASYQLQRKLDHVDSEPCEHHQIMIDETRTGHVPVVLGRKNGFCLMDLGQIIPGDNLCQFSKHCCDQGISSGCADIYANDLQCQWIDVTGIPIDDTEFLLKVTVNPEQLMEEDNYEDNLAEIDVRLSEVTLDTDTLFLQNPAPDPGACN